MRKFFQIFILLLVLGSFTIPFSSKTQASSLTEPLTLCQLPDKKWTWKSPEKPNQKILHPVETGQAVNVRCHTYDVPISAKAFIDQVRSKIMEKPDYKGAAVGLVGPKKVKGKTWDVFDIKRKDEINQQIWARKPSKNVVLMIIYTGAGSYYNQFHNSFMKLIKGAS